MFECEFEEQSRVIQSMVGRLTIYYSPARVSRIATLNSQGYTDTSVTRTGNAVRIF